MFQVNSLRWMLSAQTSAQAGAITLTGLTHGIIATVEKLAFLQFVANQIFLVG
jgi:ethanolamine ammonia-lyase large subunit